MTDDEAFSYAHEALASAEAAQAGGDFAKVAWEINKATRRAMAARLRAQQGRAHPDLEKCWADPISLLRQFEARANSRPERAVLRLDYRARKWGGALQGEHYGMGAWLGLPPPQQPTAEDFQALLDAVGVAIQSLEDEMKRKGEEGCG